VISLPKVQAPPRPAPPLSEMAEIREMFKEMNQRYMVYEPPAYYLTIKRIIDVSISMVFIVLIMSWLYPIVALMIRLTSRGPVLFIQKRTGHLGLEFDCF